MTVKISFTLTVYTDETKSRLESIIGEVKDYPQIVNWTRNDIENFLDEEYEVWLSKRTDGGWKQ